MKSQPKKRITSERANRPSPILTNRQDMANRSVMSNRLENMENISFCSSTRPKHIQSQRKHPVYSVDSKSVKTNKNDICYNKWYIKPALRMRAVQSSRNIDKTDTSYVYKELYKERYADPENPFHEKPSQKLKLLQMIPKTKFAYLQQFRASQIKRRRRVPEIVEMLAKKIRLNTQH